MYFRDGRRRIDYILAYKEYPDKPIEWQDKRKDKRQHFRRNLEELGLELEDEDSDVSLRLILCFLVQLRYTSQGAFHSHGLTEKNEQDSSLIWL